MSILNYTTTIDAGRTVMEIQALLAKAGAQAVMAEYENAMVSHVSFRINTAHGIINFRLPANVDGVYRLLQKNNKLSGKEKSREQAVHVAWRILKSWVEAQLALIQSEMVEIEQVFLPYAQTKSGQTLYEVVKQQGMAALTDQRS